MSSSTAPIRERPILFSGSMVRAILEGRKTQTRRVVILKGHNWTQGELAEWKKNPGAFSIWREGAGLYAGHGGKGRGKLVPCPYGVPGDRLWVRETFYCDHFDYPQDTPDVRSCLYYKAGGEGSGLARNGQCEGFADETFTPAWKPSIHMPRWASRLTLEVAAVRVERVQEISQQDAVAEGVPLGYIGGNATYKGPVSIDGQTPSFQFYRLWDSINAKRGHGWDRNPWVWVVEFKAL